jgi:hypothetical protein
MSNADATSNGRLAAKCKAIRLEFRVVVLASSWAVSEGQITIV